MTPTTEKKQRMSFRSSVNNTSNFESAAESITLGEEDVEKKLETPSAIENIDLAGKMDGISITLTPPPKIRRQQENNSNTTTENHCHHFFVPKRRRLGKASFPLWSTHGRVV